VGSRCTPPGFEDDPVRYSRIQPNLLGVRPLCDRAPGIFGELSVKTARAGREVVHHYPTAGVMLDPGRRFGSGCIFGRLNRQEPEWCAQALEFAEATL
jgi:hypothetical protein